MAIKILVYALSAFFFVQFTLCMTPPEQSPSPSPQLAADSPFLSPPFPSPSPSSSPSPSPESGSPLLPPSDSPVTTSSPPAPPPSDLYVPGTSPTPANSPVPAPVPTEASDINHNVDAEPKQESSGMSGGKKAGIAVGVIAAACLVGLGGLVYKKRQDNIRRTQYGYAARRELL